MGTRWSYTIPSFIIIQTLRQIKTLFPHTRISSRERTKEMSASVIRPPVPNLIDYSGSRRIYERAMEKGIEKGVEQEKRNSERKEREAALEMLKDGLSFEQIARYMKLSVEAVADIARENKLI